MWVVLKERDLPKIKIASSSELLPLALAPVIKLMAGDGEILAAWMFLTDSTSSFNKVIIPGQPTSASA